MKLFRAKVLSKQNLRGNFWYLNLQLVKTEQINFQAGQFVMVMVDRKKNIRRAYSIASTPLIDNQIGLLINVFPGGPGSQWALSCQVGDEVLFSGVFGKFVLQSQDENSLVFIATGAGIAPLKSMMDSLAEKKDQRSVELWWGLKRPEDIFWQDYFKGLGKKWKDFRLYPVISQPKDNWQGRSGRVTHYLEKLSKQELAGKGFYICGQPAMIADVSKILLKKGVVKTNIFHEMF